MTDRHATVFDRTTLQSVDRPIGEARGLPNGIFTSPAFYETERDQLFAGTWTVIGNGIDLPKPGDLKPISFMGMP